MMKRAPSEKQEPNFVRMQAKKGIIEQHLKSSLGSDGRLASIWILQGCRLSCLLEYDIEAFLRLVAVQKNNSVHQFIVQNVRT